MCIALLVTVVCIEGTQWTHVWNWEELTHLDFLNSIEAGNFRLCIMSALAGLYLFIFVFALNPFQTEVAEFEVKKQKGLVSNLSDVSSCFPCCLCSSLRTWIPPCSLLLEIQPALTVLENQNFHSCIVYAWVGSLRMAVMHWLYSMHVVFVNSVMYYTGCSVLYQYLCFCNCST